MQYLGIDKLLCNFDINIICSPKFVENNLLYQKIKRNVTLTIISQQIIHNRLLLIVISWQKSNFSDRFKLEPITTYQL